MYPLSILTFSGQKSLAAFFFVFFLSLESAATQLVDVSLGRTHLDYREYFDDAQWLRESGSGLQLTAKNEWLIREAWSLSFSVQVMNAWVNYRGKTQLGAALDTDVLHQGRSAKLDAAYHLPLGVWSFSPVFGLSKQRYNRSIQKTSETVPVESIFDWYQLSVGAKFERHFNHSPWGLAVQALYVKSIAGEFELDMSAAGLARKGAPLNAGSGSDLALAAVYQLSPSYQLSLSLKREVWRWDDSDSVQFSEPVVLTFLEPRSRKVTTSIALSLKFQY